MQMRLFAAGVALLSATSAYAEPFPLTHSAPITNVGENTAPFLLSDGLTQTLITNRNTLMANGLPASLRLWDMSSFDVDGRYVFIPAESATGAGVIRYNLNNGAFKVMMVGDGSGTRTANPASFDPLVGDYSRFDPSTWTPWETVLTGEETTGGRLFEIRNPRTLGTPNVKWLTKIPAVAHEGLRFDGDGNLYFVDEDNSGSIYKIKTLQKGKLTQGQTFVLKVTAFTGAANEVWNSATNNGLVRTGAATWVPMTTPTGIPLTDANPFVYVTTTGGRTAADEIGGTPFGRPEDMTFKTLANGNEAFFFTATRENTVYKVELTGGNAADVRVFMNQSTTDLATGVAVQGAFSSPDNLATGADGSIYALEDLEPNGGDIWKAIDANNDGVAEAMGRWASLGVTGSE